MSLTLFTLGLLCARSAQAQDDWNVTGSPNNGNPIQPLGSVYPLTGTATGAATNTYPSDMTDAAKRAPYNDPVYGWVDNSQWLQAASNGPHSYDPNPLGVPYLYYGGTTSPPGTSIALNATAHNYALNNSYYGSFNPKAPPFFTNQYYQNPSDCEPINGNVTGRAKGTLWANWNWTGSGAAPDHLDILLTTNVQASKSYENGSEETDLIATATASDGDPFNETASSDGPGGREQAGGRHLLRVPVSGGVAVSLNGNVSASATNNLQYGGFSYPYYQIYGGRNPTGARSYASVSATAMVDSRDVTITSDIDPTYKKGRVADRVGHPVQDQWGNDLYEPVQNKLDADGTGHGDVGLAASPQSVMVPTPSDSYLYVTYKGNYSGSWHVSGLMEWWYSALTGSSAVGTLIRSFDESGFVVSYVRPNDPQVIGYDPYDGTPLYSQAVPGKTGTDHVHLTCEDAAPYSDSGGEGAFATANY